MIKLITDILNGLYDVFNVTIPGFHVSISNVVLGLMIISLLIFFIKQGGSNK